MNTLISGISGFIGSHFARNQAERGFCVYGLSRKAQTHSQNIYQWSVADGPPTKVLKQIRPTLILHAAGNAHPLMSMENPDFDKESNVESTRMLLEGMRSSGCSARFVLLSSAAVYGQPTELPVSEAAPIKPLSPYGFHKFEAEELCRKYGEEHGIEWAGLRIFSAYGPGLRRQVIYDAARRALADGSLVLHGTGEETRDFVHIDDVSEGIAIVSTHMAARGKVFNLASGRETPIREVGNMILAAAGSNSTVRFEGEAQAGLPTRWKADISSIGALGFSPCVPLEQGIEETVRWVQSLFPRD